MTCFSQQIPLLVLLYFPLVNRVLRKGAWCCSSLLSSLSLVYYYHIIIIIIILLFYSVTPLLLLLSSISPITSLSLYSFFSAVLSVRINLGVFGSFLFIYFIIHTLPYLFFLIVDRLSTICTRRMEGW